MPDYVLRVLTPEQGDARYSTPDKVAEAITDALQSDVPGLVAEAIADDPTVVNAAADAVDNELAARDLVEEAEFFPEGVSGGFVGENGRATDLVFDAEGNVISDTISRWAGRLEDEGLVGGAVDSVSYGGGFVGENGRATELWVDDHGKVYQSTIDAWTSRMTLPPTEFDEFDIMAGPDILTVGDSLTASGNIRNKIAELTGRTVRNMGVGGETSTGILARLGVWPLLITPTGMTIPASGSVDVTYKSSYHTPGTIRLLLQGTGVREGDNLLWGTIAGVRVRLSIRLKDPAVAYPSGSDLDIYQITRDGTGAAVTLKRPEPFIPEHGLARSGDIVIAWLGQNGPSDDATFAGFQAMEQWFTRAGTRFLFMTRPTGSSTGWTDFEKKMADRFGRRYCNVRRFLIDDALSYMNLTPTTQDEADIAAGTVPTTLRTDTVHHTAAAQVAIAEYLLYPRLRELDMV